MQHKPMSSTCALSSCFLNRKKKAEEAAALSCISEIASQSLLVDLQHALKHRFERKMKSLLLQVLLVSYFSLFGFLPLSTRRVSSIHNVTVKPSRFSLNLRVEDVLYTLVHKSKLYRNSPFLEIFLAKGQTKRYFQTAASVFT